MLRAFQSTTCPKLLASLSSSIPSFARQSKFIQRATAFCSLQFLLALFNAISTGKTSLNQIAIQLSLITESLHALSPQAIHQRLHRTIIGAESFLIYCLSHVIAEKCSSAPHIKYPFARIIIEDSSQLALHVNSAEEFPAHGNHHGCTAGCKIDLCFDLLTGQSLINDLHIATTQDRTLGIEILDHLRPNDLILRDMGYFSLAVFAEIEHKQAYWLSRLPRGVHATNEAGTSIEKVLQKAKTDTIDIPCHLGEKARHPARLIAVRCSEQERRKNRRQLRESYKKKGKTPTREQFTRCDWHIMVTNIPQSMQSPSQLHELYRQRWQIELVFRGWKKNHNFQQLHRHRTSATHLKVLILAAMILLSLSLRMAREVQQKMSAGEAEWFSVEKYFEAMSQKIGRLKTLIELAIIPIDHRHLKTQKRKRKTLIHQQINSLA